MQTTPAVLLPVRTTPLLLRLAWPIAVEHLLNISLLWVDSVIINHKLGTAGFAAVQFSGQIFNLLTLVLAVIATGAAIVIAHQVGAQQRAEAGETAAQSLGTGLLVSAAIAGSLFLGAPALLRLLGAGPEVHPLGVTFMQTLALFVPAEATLAISGAALRATGNTRSPMLITVVVNLINAVLNYVLVWGTPAIALGGLTIPAIGGGWGMMGSALGTGLARLSGAALIIPLVLWRSGLPLKALSFVRLQRVTLMRVARMGVPGALEFISYQASQFLLTMLVAPLGTAVIAARGLTFQIESFAIAPAVGLSAAASILVGQRMGARQREEAVTAGGRALALGFGAMALLALLLFLFARPLAGIFTTDPAVLDLATVTLRLSALYKLGQCFNIVGGGIFRGAGNPQWPTGTTALGSWLITVPLSFLLIRLGFGLPGVLAAMATDEMLRGALNLWYFRTPHWRFREV